MPKLIDLTGQRFGKLVVIERGPNTKSRTTRWICTCDCGNKTLTCADLLRNGTVKSCGCLNKSPELFEKYTDLTGRRFGKWTVLYKIEKGVEKRRNPAWMCRCDCGREERRRAIVLVRGESVRCGSCNNAGNKGKTTHGGSKHPLYGVWKAMRQRCNNDWHPEYCRYGQRGISVCPEWNNDFAAFYEWALGHGYGRGLTIERIDNNAGYSPVNCRWATPKEQAYNRRDNHWVDICGKTKTITQWADENGIDCATLAGRIARGIKGKNLLRPADQRYARSFTP